MSGTPALNVSKSTNLLPFVVAEIARPGLDRIAGRLIDDIDIERVYGLALHFQDYVRASLGIDDEVSPARAYRNVRTDIAEVWNIFKEPFQVVFDIPFRNERLCHQQSLANILVGSFYKGRAARVTAQG